MRILCDMCKKAWSFHVFFFVGLFSVFTLSAQEIWTENFDYGIWKEAMAECGVDMTFYTLRERSLDEILPWDFIDTGVSRKFLEREWQRAKEGVVTENCRQKCSACGAMKFKGGVCLEGKN